MGDMKMHCHFSIIFERLWQFWLVIIVSLFNAIDDIIDVIEEIGTAGVANVLMQEGFWVLLGIFGVSLAVFLIQFLRWRKTWIILEDNLVVWERNTLNRKKNTIAIENISAVNMERNLFERIVGTYKIKMDTNSMTTASETDIVIVLREDIAIAFRKTLLERISAIKGNTEGTALSEERQPDELSHAAIQEGRYGDRKVFHCTPADMLRHSFYAMSIWSLLVAVVCVGIVIVLISVMGFSEFIDESWGVLTALIMTILAAIYNLIKKFVNGYDFTAYRDGGDIHVKCGLIKIKSYTVPVDKITAIQIEQPPFSRIFKKYNVKVVTVGMGDEDEESSNITMSLSEKDLKEQMMELLPEYGWADISEVKREEKGGIAVRMVKSIKWHIAAVAAGLIMYFEAGQPLWMALAIPAAVDAYINLLYFMSHRTSGFKMKEEGIMLFNGYFTKIYTICAYSRIQNMTVTYHPVARHIGIGEGVLFMLNTAAALPFMKVEAIEEVTRSVIGEQYDK